MSPPAWHLEYVREVIVAMLRFLTLCRFSTPRTQGWLPECPGNQTAAPASAQGFRTRSHLSCWDMARSLRARHSQNSTRSREAPPAYLTDAMRLGAEALQPR